jgi:hypothetical protein
MAAGQKRNREEIYGILQNFTGSAGIGGCGSLAGSDAGGLAVPDKTG